MWGIKIVTWVFYRDEDDSLHQSQLYIIQWLDGSQRHDRPLEPNGYNLEENLPQSAEAEIAAKSGFCKVLNEGSERLRNFGCGKNLFFYLPTTQQRALKLAQPGSV